jgi:hypothetical protein
VQVANEILVAYLQNRQGSMPPNTNLAETGKALGEMLKELVKAVEQA